MKKGHMKIVALVGLVVALGGCKLGSHTHETTLIVDSEAGVQVTERIVRNGRVVKSVGDAGFE
jgi:hypothetical protein